MLTKEGSDLVNIAECIISPEVRLVRVITLIVDVYCQQLEMPTNETIIRSSFGFDCCLFPLCLSEKEKEDIVYVSSYTNYT